jgi:hypothetical protein
MRFARRVLAVVLVSAAILPNLTTADDPALRSDEPRGLAGKIQRGTSAGEVRRLLGPPKRTARQLLYRRAIEQWRYEEPARMLIDFEHTKGQDARVLSVRKTT